MYPSLYYAFKDLFGLDWPGLKMVQMFGFFVALAFLTSAYFWTKELKRKENEGLIGPTPNKVLKGQKATPAELFFAGILGFLIGYKLLYIVFNFSAFTENTQGFLLSLDGSLIGGILFAAGSVYLKYREKEKTKLASPVWVDEPLHPYQHVGNMTLIAAFAGLTGAKIFHNLENWKTFTADPWGSLLSFDGLTMYGGLILASITLIWYGRKYGIPTPHLIDSSAPSIMIGYAVGRIGCHMAGDGDWGIPNSAYTANTDGSVVIGTAEQFQSALIANKSAFIQEWGSLENVKHVAVQAPSWLPDWMVAYTYPHNVINEGIPLANCMTDKYCNYLPLPVFPTPFYETIMCFFLFLILWTIRKRIKVPGMLFSIYLILNGIERFFIEKIRVNTLGEFLGMKVTQAEMIATGLFILGIIGVIYFKKIDKRSGEQRVMRDE